MASVSRTEENTGSELVGFNVPINTLQVISETSLSSQPSAPVLTTPNKNNQATEHTNNIKITQPKKSP